jgi:hypothetical protein
MAGYNAPLPNMPQTTPPATDTASPVGDDPKVDTDLKKRNDTFRSSIYVCKQFRKKMIGTWTQNVDYRRGKPFQTQTDEDRVVVNLDWSMTKAKQAALFSQVPQVRIDHNPQTVQAGPWLHAFEQRLNDTLVVAGVETAMDECLPDCINAAGFGAAIVAHEEITDTVQIPSINLSFYPPEVADKIRTTKMMPDGSPVPMKDMPRTLEHRYTITRISPADFLYPIEYTGSDFDNAPWVGRSGRIGWAQAKNLFGLTDADRDNVVGDDRTVLDKITHEIDKDTLNLEEKVSFDEIFYKEFHYDPLAKSYFTIRHLVFCTGKDEPVIDEQWKGQKFDPQTGHLTGSLKYPIRVLTLTYISDETLPPSDSAIGRPQVNEINKARTQMIMQRERSLPVRWVDLNRVDPTILISLMRGTWQPFIPVQGPGDKVIGEVARASMPQENFAFDKIAKNDWAEATTIGANQEGSGQGVETEGEAQIIQQNFSTRIGRERARTARFFVSMAEVLGGLICLFEPPESFGQGFDPTISRTLSYSILSDSTVLVDSNQRLKRLIDFTNFSAKSGWVDVNPVLREIATLSGLDPNVVIRPPDPKPPVEPSISLRLTGSEDLLNPLVLAFLMKSGQAPEIPLIEQAKITIAAAATPQTPGMPPGPGGMPPPSPDGNTPPAGMAPPPAPVPPPSPAPPQVGEAHPQWSLTPRINTRSDSDVNKG